VITDLCVLDFAPATKRMRIKSLHPGKTLDQVKAATGFALEVCDPLGTTVEPNAEQLHILRTEVDPGRYILGRVG
jgi:glutaconate CoA-transferase subunit B